MSTAPAPVTAKTSWLSRFGHEVGVILGVVAKDAEPVEKIAAATATAMLPQFAPQIAYADNLATRILDSVKNVEGTFVAVGQSTNSAAKLQAVVGGISSEMDAWVQANFPGAAAISQASRAGLVNAVVAIANDVDPNLAIAAPTPTAVSAGAAAVAAVAAAKPAS
jgi:hypothetical protein